MKIRAMEARRAVYRRLYELRVESPGLYFGPSDLAEVAAEPGLSAALAFGLEMGHLDKRRGHYGLTAIGMLFTEKEGYVEVE